MLRMTRRSLARRVFLALLVVSLLGFGSLLWHLYNTRDELRHSTLLLQALEITEGLKSDSDMHSLPLSYAGGELYYTLYNAQGVALWHSDNLPRPLRMRAGTLNDALRPMRLKSYRGHGKVIGVPVPLEGGSTLIVSKLDTLERKLIDALLQTRLLHGLLALPLVLLCTALLMWGLMRWTLRPVREAAALAAGISPDTPDRRIPLKRLPAEIQPLAQAANQALDRLGHALDTQKQLVADAAHELRTPLTVLDLRLQKMQSEGKADWPSIEGEMRQLRRLVEQLLTLARRDHAGNTSPATGTVSLSRLTREIIASLIPLFEQQSRELCADIEDRISVVADADALRDAIRNLIENALVHGKGSVSVKLHRTPESDIFLDVCDEGPGVPAHQRELVFQRFHKGRSDGNGSGLGLAIARQALQHAGAHIQFLETAFCTVRIRFPATSENRQPNLSI
ncbi:sensor histidine kinase [Mesopusillimonas faecipullorum]|nr:HAMP domain-containing sensor histidine kinase [Mesopusillimonas faecipullorum]